MLTVCFYMKTAFPSSNNVNALNYCIQLKIYIVPSFNILAFFKTTVDFKDFFRLVDKYF